MTLHFHWRRWLKQSSNINTHPLPSKGTSVKIQQQWTFWRPKYSYPFKVIVEIPLCVYINIPVSGSRDHVSVVSTLLPILLDTHWFPLILPHFPFVLLFQGDASTFPSFHSYLGWAARENDATYSLRSCNGCSSPLCTWNVQEKNNVTVIKWFWARACFLTCTVTSYTLSADYFKDKHHFCAQTDICLPCVQHQQRSHFSSVYLEQNNKLPILAGSLCPPRCLCFSALSFLHPLQNFAQVSPHFVHVTLYLWRKASKASCALTLLLWCKYIYSSPLSIKCTVGLIPKWL